MARKSEEKSATRPSWVTAMRYGVRVIAAGVLLASGLYAFHRVEEFLIRDPRFVFNGPAEFGYESPSLQLSGIRYASRAQVLRVFAIDYGRSLYRLPLAARRTSLRSLDWIRDASISRVWPNHVLVRIQER